MVEPHSAEAAMKSLWTKVDVVPPLVENEVPLGLLLLRFSTDPNHGEASSSDFL